ncbi:MAG: DUF11 domain-containing protein, partial [Methanobrevibacter sp.]|nr:DUF11 domain-containing protein [Methanobrevibacter sp.]
PGNSIFVYDSEFINNTAYGINANGGLGGAIAVNGSDDHIVNSKFENNQAIQGGAFYLDGNDVYIVDSNFTDNRAIQGGAGYIKGNDSFVEGSLFKENYATHDDLRFPVSSVLQNMPTEGGAIHIYGENININSSEFNNNKACAESDAETSTGGGAIYVEGKNATVSDSKFNANSALKGGAIFIIVNETKVIGSNFTDNSAFNFDDETKGVGGAIYLENAHNSEIIESNFVNNTASINGGAINWNECADNGRIENSVFENNTASEDGGAVFWTGYEGIISESNFTTNTANRGGAVFWTGHDGKIQDSRFISNNATQGGAVFLQHDAKGENIGMNIENSYFENNTASEDGGAINWHDGNNVNIVDSTFVQNTAKRGGAVFINATDGGVNGSGFTYNEAILGGAVYLNNERLTISKDDFDYNNAVQGGAIYMAADNNKVDGSNFNYNNATYTLRVNGTDNRKTKGGAIYIAGKNNAVENSKFYNNTAVATNESSRIVQTTPGLLGAYLETTGVNDDGLGGAIYVDGNVNSISSSEFDYNVARNGSAIYNDAEGTYFFNDTFIKNQAWSYILEVNTTEAKYYYGDVVKVNVYNYVAGDNILNGIYNALDVSAVTFNNVEYIIDDDVSKLERTVKSDINPIDGAKKDALYQDNRERYQPIVVEIYYNNSETPASKGLLGAANDYTLVKNQTVLTDYEGNYTIDVSGLTPGNYSILAYHPEDRNYKYIITQNVFEVIPIVDLSIEKYIAEDPVLVGDNVEFTIVVSNAANASEATNVNINEILPNGLTVIDTDPSVGNYDSSKNIWHIDSLANGTLAILVITAKTSQAGLFNNTVEVSCDEDEWNYTNNNDTLEFSVITIVDLDIVKTVDINDTDIGDVVTFTIVVTNNGPSNATNVVINDTLPDGLQFEKGQLNHIVPFLAKGDSYNFTVVARTTQKGTFTNVAKVNCAENNTVKSANATVNVYVVDLKINKSA